MSTTRSILKALAPRQVDIIFENDYYHILHGLTAQVKAGESTPIRLATFGISLGDPEREFFTAINAAYKPRQKRSRVMVGVADGQFNQGFNLSDKVHLLLFNLSKRYPNIDFRVVTRSHTKMLLTPGLCIVGSKNFSSCSNVKDTEKWFEAMLMSKNKSLLTEARHKFDEVWSDKSRRVTLDGPSKKMFS